MIDVSVDCHAGSWRSWLGCRRSKRTADKVDIEVVYCALRTGYRIEQSRWRDQPIMIEASVGCLAGSRRAPNLAENRKVKKNRMIEVER